MFQSSIRNIDATEVQSLELMQSFEVFQTCICNRSVSEVQLFELGQAFEVFQSNASYFGSNKVERLEV